MPPSILKHLAGLLVIAASTQPVRAQGAATPPAAPSTATAFGDLIDLGKQLQISDSDGTKLQFVERPVMNWSNPTRIAPQTGSIFIWQRDGRPQVIGTIFTFAYDNQIRMKHELHSLAQQPLTAEYRGQTTWKPTQPGIQWRPFTDGPVPHTNPRLRLTQMRGIARQFSSTLEEPEGNQTQLELKPTPLHRYASEKEKVLDGAIFSFAHGTDPEVLILIEAVDPAGSGATWQYAFARFHYWKVSVSDPSGEVIWMAESQMDLQSVEIGDSRTISRPYISYYVERRQIE